MLPRAEVITTAIGILFIRFVRSAAPAVPTITAPKLFPPETCKSQLPNIEVSPVSSIARTTIDIPAIKPKIDQEIRLPVSRSVVCLHPSAPTSNRRAPPTAIKERGNRAAEANTYAIATQNRTRQVYRK